MARPVDILPATEDQEGSSSITDDEQPQEHEESESSDDETEETQDYWLLYPLLCASLESEASGYLTVMRNNIKEHVKNIISGMGEEKARELEDGWKAIYLMDAQLYAKRAHLICQLGQILVGSMVNK